MSSLSALLRQLLRLTCPVSVLLIVSTLIAGERRDRVGDPLPAEALSRLGTTRLRHGGSIHSFAFPPDGKTLVASGVDGVRIWDAATGKQIRRVRPGAAGTGTTDVSPDGKYAAVLLPDREANVGLLEVATGRIVQRFRTKRQTKSLCFAPDGKTVATIGYDGEIDLWDPATGKALGALKGHQDQVWSVTFSTDAKTLISAGDDRIIRFWDVASGKQQRQIVTKSGVNQIALSPDGRLLASLGHIKHTAGRFSWWRSELVIRLWDTHTGKELRQLTMTPIEVMPGRTVAFSTFLFTRDGKRLVTGGYDGVVRMWDMATGKELRQFAGFAGGPHAFALHPDGKTLAAIDGGSTIRLIRLDTGADRLPLVGHRAGVGFVHIRPDDRVAVTSSWEGLLQFWDARSGEMQRKLSGKSREVLQMLPDGKTYLAAGDDKKLHVFELDTGKEVRVIPGWNGRQDGFALSPDGRVLAQADAKSQPVLLSDSATGKNLHSLSEFPQPIMGMSFPADGQSLFLWSADKTVTVWDPATGKKRRHFSGPDDQNSVWRPVGGNSWTSFMAALSPDGKLLAFGFQNSRIAKPGTLPIVDTTTGKEIRRFSTAADGVSKVVFSPDGKSVAWGGWSEGTVYLGEIATGRQRHHFTGHTGRIVSLAFSVDGKMLISGSQDTTALVWDLTGRLTRGQKFGAALTAEELESHWNTLAAEDAEAAFRAMQALAADPARSVPYFRKRLHPIAAADEKRLQQSIADLDSDQFAIREKATRELEKLGIAALHAMRKALAGKPALETRRRLEPLIEKWEREESATSGEKLRIWRSLEVLERAGKPEAKDVLATLAKGAPGVRQTLEARVALERMAK